MNIIVKSDRTIEKEFTVKDGSQNENKITELNFTFPDEFSGFIPKIAFITEDGNFSDYIENGKYILKNNITKYQEVLCFIWLTESTTDKDFRSEIFKLKFYYNEKPSDYVPSEQEKTQIELMMQELEVLIERVGALPNLSIKIVEELPVTDINPKVIYMVLREDSEPNYIYDEYLYVDNEFKNIGSTNTNLEDYVKDTDYSTTQKGGVLKISDAYGTAITQDGVLQSVSKTNSEYNEANNEMFISKGTLENVIVGKQLINQEKLDEELENLDVDGDKNFTFVQNQSSDTWVIVHNLNKYPAVTVIDSAGSEVTGEVEYLDINTIRITFKGSFKGTATLN